MIRPISLRSIPIWALSRVRASSSSVSVSSVFSNCRGDLQVQQFNRRLNSLLTSSSSSWFSTKSSPPPTETSGQEVKDGEESKRAPDLSGPSSEEGLKEYKTSFGKDIFLGNFDVSLLTFPEVLEKEQHETLHEMLGPIERYFDEKGN